jgi:hypothetical protein
MPYCAITSVLIKETAPAVREHPEARTTETKGAPVATTSVPARVREATTRIERGRALYAEHAEEIRFDEGVWLVPSQHDASSVYEVILGYRGESCECADYDHHGHEEACKHIVAATIARAKTAPCDGCGQPSGTESSSRCIPSTSR